jgi:1-aminocyclopropane-1-carboxylate deaminase/D-cysteine desulfhydrase-like pyridoxal-dependent ACC family enzyme
MTETVFDTLSLSRENVRWEDYLDRLTPVEEHGGILFKREDRFAPLGYGGINGSKLRQCIWLVDDYVRRAANPVGVISGTSVKSPQLPMGSAVANHYGLESVHVIGATTPETAITHPNVALATCFGARWRIEKVAYNPALQRGVGRLMAEDRHLRDFFYLEYGITVDHKWRMNGPERVESFHEIGARQVRNIPDHVGNLIIPAGSCNTTVSILFGLALDRPSRLENVHLIGIGPQKLQWIEERLEILQRVYDDMDLRPFQRAYHDHPSIEAHWNLRTSGFYDEAGGGFDDRAFTLHHYDLHGTGWVDYQDEMPFEWEGIELHPTYEGKVMSYLADSDQLRPLLYEDTTLFWIVGSKPYAEAMRSVLPERAPKKLPIY